jgi:hypothetical protein
MAYTKKKTLPKGLKEAKSQWDKIKKRRDKPKKEHKLPKKLKFKC